jgi:hypothetical protein
MRTRGTTIALALLLAATARADAPVSLIARGPGSPAAVGTVPLWARAGVAPTPLAARFGATQSTGTRAAASGNAKALWPALLSGLVPGAGQVRNGALLRGLGYFAIEIGGWVAYGAFRDGGKERWADLGRLADARTGSWEYERYHARAPDPDSCTAYGCVYGLWSETSDQEIRDLQTREDRGRFYEYLTRDAYACGWDTPASRALYRGVWNDRESLLSAKRWAGRVILLNHFVSAIDAFIGARARRMQLDGQTQLSLDLHGLPRRIEPELRVTRRFGGPPTR